MHSFPEWRFPAKHSSDPPALRRWFYRLRPSLFDTVPRSMSKERFEKKNVCFIFTVYHFFLSVLFDCKYTCTCRSLSKLITRYNLMSSI